MSDSDPEDTSQPEIVSAEPADAVIEAQEAAYLGTIRVYVNQQAFYPEGDARLTELAKKYGFNPPRETTEPHIDDIKVSHVDNAIRSYDAPWIGALSPDAWRNLVEDGHLKLFTHEGSLVYVTTRTRSFKTEPITEQEAIKLMLILIDGRARFKTLLRESERTGKSFWVFIRIFSCDIFSNSDLLERLLHGENTRNHLFASLGAAFDYGDHLRSFLKIRKGITLANPPGPVDKSVSSSFCSFASSRARTLIAAQVLSKTLVSYIAEKETKKRTEGISFWFNGFGAASPLIFIGLDITLETLEKLDHTREIFSPENFYFFSKLVRIEGIKNPFALADQTTRGGEETKETSCRNLAQVLRGVLGNIDSSLNAFKRKFGQAPPPWYSEKHIPVEMARAFQAGLRLLADRLESDLTDLELPSKVHAKLVTYDDLLSLTPDTAGTEITRFIAACESHLLSPLAELAAAFVQLARKNSDLKLPILYWKSFQDVEPFILELCLPTKGIESIMAKKRKGQPKEGGPLWYEDEDWANAWVEFLRALWFDHEMIIKEVLAAKAKVAAVSPHDRQALFDHFVEEGEQSRPEGKAIGQNLHLAFAQWKSDGTLTPSLPPPSFEECCVWLRPKCKTLLQILAAIENVDADPPPLFSTYLTLVDGNPRFPILNLPSQLDQLVENIIKKNTAKVGYKSLPAAVDSALSNLDSIRPDSLATGNNVQDEEEDQATSNGEEGEKEVEKVAEKVVGDQDQGEVEQGNKGEKGKEKENGQDTPAVRTEGDKENAGDDSSLEGGGGAAKQRTKKATKGKGKGKGKAKVDSSSKKEKKKKDVVAAFKPSTGATGVRSSARLRDRSTSLEAESKGSNAPALEDEGDALQEGSPTVEEEAEGDELPEGSPVVETVKELDFRQAPPTPGPSSSAADANQQERSTPTPPAPFASTSAAAEPATIETHPASQGASSSSSNQPKPLTPRSIPARFSPVVAQDSSGSSNPAILSSSSGAGEKQLPPFLLPSSSSNLSTSSSNGAASDSSHEASIYKSFDQSIEHSRSLILDGQNLFASDSAGRNLRNYTSSSLSNDREKRARFLEMSFKATSALIDEIVRRFRLSDAYPPFGRTTDLASFDIDDFARHFRAFIDARGEGQNEGEDETFDDEVTKESLGSLTLELHHIATGIVLRIFRDVDSKVYEFWENFASIFLGNH